MTSTTAVKNEIQRFLKSNEPEVLCITGHWGVGKTYTWQSILNHMRASGEVGLVRYSYVSLFGIASLEALKISLFENMEFLLPQAGNGPGRLVSSALSAFKGSKRLVGLAGALPRVGDAISRSQPLLFTTIRNQIICVDDLERRGAITVKDVLGLISYLREQRGCKIALLLNQSQLDEGGSKEFSDLFEKVIDVRLVFSPTPAEAAGIAIQETDELSVAIKQQCVRLHIANIRVIKKIERLIRMLAPIVRVTTAEVERQMVHSLVLLGWCQFDSGADPPPMAYLRESAMVRYVQRKHDNQEENADERRWDLILSQYDWGVADDFDLALMDYVETSILDAEEMNRAATEVAKKWAAASKTGSFEASWRSLHDSFADNEDDVVRSIVDGIKNNFEAVSRSNLDEAVLILRELGRDPEADSLIDIADQKGTDDFWISNDPFNRVMRDTRMIALAKARGEAAQPVLQFETDLARAAESMNVVKLSQLAAVPVTEYEALFESRAGEQLRSLILSALEFRNISNASDDMKTIVVKTESALRSIASKSKLNELRVQKFGVRLAQSVETDENGG
jgi:hypothetical protein